MPQVPLRAQFNENGNLVLSPRVSGSNWYIEQNHEFGLSFELYEEPEYGGQPQFIKRFNTAKQAYDAAMELT